MNPGVRAHARVLLCLLAFVAGCGSTEPIPFEGTYDMVSANGQALPMAPAAQDALESAVMVINADHSFIANAHYRTLTGLPYGATIQGVVTRSGNDLVYAAAASPPATPFATGHVMPGVVTYVQPSGDVFLFQRR